MSRKDLTPGKRKEYDDRYKKKHQKKCLNCNKLVWSMRCKKCAAIYRGENNPKRTWSKESKNKIKGENNPNWKGMEITYKGIHTWAQRKFKKPDKCQKCSKNGRLDWANISGKYKRDIKDWLALCRGCHMKYDYKRGIR